MQARSTILRERFGASGSRSLDYDPRNASKSSSQRANINYNNEYVRRNKNTVVLLAKWRDDSGGSRVMIHLRKCSLDEEIDVDELSAQVKKASELIRQCKSKLKNTGTASTTTTDSTVDIHLSLLIAYFSAMLGRFHNG